MVDTRVGLGVHTYPGKGRRTGRLRVMQKVVHVYKKWLMGSSLKYPANTATASMPSRGYASGEDGLTRFILENWGLWSARVARAVYGPAQGYANG